MVQKTFSYYFKQTNPMTWELAKFEGSEGGDDPQPTVVYHLKGDPFTPGKWACDCPATWGGKNRKLVECKHGVWLQRWLQIQHNGNHKGKVIYYNNLTNKFHILKGLEVQTE
jgi:hypothetical protein